MNSNLESAKRSAAVEACNFVRSTFSDSVMLGIGTGSTIKYFVDTCIDFIKGRNLVPSSLDTGIYLKNKGLKDVLDIGFADELDIYIDGADEVSSKLDLIKGRGGALLREKTLAVRAKHRIYIVDHSKYTGKPYLYLKPVPIEILQHTLPDVLKALKTFEDVTAVLRIDSSKDGPVITDNGNFIIDLKFSKPIENPDLVHEKLKLIHGVVETGIFPAHLVDYVIIGYDDKSTMLERKTSQG